MKRFKMRGARLLALFLFVFSAIFVGYVVNSLRPAALPEPQYRAINGVLDLRDFYLDEAIKIVGQWERFANVCFENRPDNFNQLHYFSEFVDIPMPLTETTDHPSAYRLLILNNASITEAYLSLSPLQSDFFVTLNGEHIFDNTMKGEESSLFPVLSTATFRLDFDETRFYQELVIFIVSEYNGTDFFLSEFVLGDSDAVQMYLLKRVATWAFVVGLLITLMASRILFMMMCPENESASLMTIIDGAIAFRLLMGIPGMYHIKIILLGMSVTNESIARLNFLPVLFIGAMVIHLIARITNGYEFVSKKWVWGIMAFTGLVGTFLFFNIYLIATTAGFLLYVFLFLPGSTVSVYMLWRHLRKTGITFLNILHASSVLLVGIILLYDIFGMRFDQSNPIVLTAGYFGLILLHLTASLWDNQSKYKEHEKLSEGLEEIVKLRTNELEEAYLKMADMVNKDYMTGVYNRMYFEESLKEIMRKANDTPKNLFLSLMDFDNFKNINDTYGHDAGDAQIISFVEVVQKLKPEGSIFARIGGEEFVILAENSSEEEFLGSLENIRQEMQKIAEKDETKTTMSAGASRHMSKMDFKTFMKQTDMRLYEAKKTGKNKIVFK